MIDRQDGTYIDREKLFLFTKKLLPLHRIYLMKYINKTI